MNSKTDPPDLSSYLSRPTEPQLELPRLFKTDAALIIFDIGCCEGEDSIRYSKMYPRGRVVAFEPLPENQAIVLENFKRYDVQNAILLPWALSNRAGTVDFHVSCGTPSSPWEGENWNYGNKASSLLPPTSSEPMHGWIKFKNVITVQTQTLDEVCRQQEIDHIDFVHMDVQGAEALVLEGAARTLPRITSIWLEVSNRELYKGQKLRSEIEQMLKARGFMLVFQSLSDVEGDQFYVNRREMRAWKYLAKRVVNRVRTVVRLRTRLRDLMRRLMGP